MLNLVSGAIVDAVLAEAAPGAPGRRAPGDHRRQGTGPQRGSAPQRQRQRRAGHRGAGRSRSATGRHDHVQRAQPVGFEFRRRSGVSAGGLRSRRWGTRETINERRAQGAATGPGRDHHLSRRTGRALGRGPHRRRRRGRGVRWTAARGGDRRPDRRRGVDRRRRARAGRDAVGTVLRLGDRWCAARRAGRGLVDLDLGSERRSARVVAGRGRRRAGGQRLVARSARAPGRGRRRATSPAR